jgi:predicted amidophosphoribosyltransferase
MEDRLADDLQCPVCRGKVDVSFVVCPVCTTRLRQSCGSCNAPLEAIWQVCPYCATPVVSSGYANDEIRHPVPVRPRDRS